MEQPQRTQLELYAQVSAAYQQATFWRLLVKNWQFQEGKWRRSLWIFLYILQLVISLIIVFLVSPALEDFIYFSILVFLIVILFILIRFSTYLLEISFCSNFDLDSSECRSLYHSFRADWEFCRHLLFRNELSDRKFTPYDVKEVRPLLDLEQQTLGAYVARNPLHSWIYATSGATIAASIAASATNWPLKVVILVASVGGLGIVILHLIPMFITVQRRQYELHRWLTWYEADVPKPTAANSDSANLLPG